MNKLILIFFLVFASTIQSQEQNQEKSSNSQSFSLEQAIAHALENSYSAINSRRDLEIATKKEWQAIANGLPQLTGTLSYTDNLSLQKSLLPAIIFGGKPDEYVTVAFGVQHNTSALLRLSQIIFDGSYIVGLQASKVFSEYTQNTKQKSDINTKAMVIGAYGNVLLTEESIAIIKKNIATIEKTLADTKEIYKNGLTEEETVEQLSITLSSLKSNLDYNTRLLDINYKLLKISLGIDINNAIVLTDKLDNLSAKNIDAPNMDFNIQDNIDYKNAKVFEKQKTLEYKLQKTYSMPSLVFLANLGTNAFNSQFKIFSTEQPWLYYSNIGLSLNVPIFSGWGRGVQSQSARISMQQAKTKLLEAEQQIKMQYDRAKTDYEYSIADHLTAKTNLNLAERIERKQNTKFTQGLSTSFDYNDAQQQLYSAQQKYLQTMTNIINTRANLEKITTK